MSNDYLASSSSPCSTIALTDRCLKFWGFTRWHKLMEANPSYRIYQMHNVQHVVFLGRKLCTVTVLRPWIYLQHHGPSKYRSKSVYLHVCHETQCLCFFSLGWSFLPEMLVRQHPRNQRCLE